MRFLGCKGSIISGSGIEGNHTVKRRSIKLRGNFNEILDYSSRGKRPNVTTFLGTLKNNSLQVGEDMYISSCITDLVWAFSRLTTPLQQAPEVANHQQPPVPGWSTFNALLFPETSGSSVVGYCPMLQGSSTELTTIYTVLKQVQKICESVHQKDAVITFDQAIYSKAKQIQWSLPDEFKDTVIRLGGFHIVLNCLALLGKKYQNSGLEDLLIESGVYGAGTATAMMKGKSYNRAVREYITMVLLLLQFLRAERTGNWDLHIATTSQMIPYFFAMDRRNYSKWLPVYLADMTALSSKHPLVHKESLDGNHSVSRSQHSFSKVSTDLALEQSVNRDSKSKGGIIGMSQNPNALDRWFLTCHERAAITTAFKEICCLNDCNENSVHKDGSSTRIRRDESDVGKIVNCFDSGLMANPFSEDADQLLNIASGVVLPVDVASRLVESTTTGLAEMNKFIQKRLNSNETSFWEPISNLKIKTFDCAVKKVDVKTKDEKVFTIGGDRDLFGRLLLVAKVRNVDIKEVLSYELASVPISLAHPDGSLRKTAKHVLLSILERDEVVEPNLPKRRATPVAYIIDGMALVQATKSSGALTFGDLASKYFDVVTSPLKDFDCSRVDVVLDQYWSLSIKNAERMKRGAGSTLEVMINSPATPVPKQWQKYLSNPRNKTNLISFLSETWRRTAMQQLPQGKVLVIGGGFRNGKLAVSMQRQNAEFVRPLHADHEEADTRLLLHAQHAAKNFARVVIQSPDTEVLALSVSHYDEIGCQEL